MPPFTRRWLSVLAAALGLFGCVALAGMAGWFRAPESVDQAQARWQARPPSYTSGVLAKYAALVSSATEGAVTTPRPNG